MTVLLMLLVCVAYDFIKWFIDVIIRQSGDEEAVGRQEPWNKENENER